MSSKQCIRDVLSKKKAGRLPVFPVMDNYYAKDKTHLKSEIKNNDTLAINAVLFDAWEKFKYDGMVVHFNPQNFMKFKLEGVDPTGEKLNFGCEIDKEGLIKELDCVKWIIDRVGDSCFLTVPARSPFEMAALLRKPSMFYADLMDSEGLIFKLMDYCYEIQLEITSKLMEVGIDSITVKDSLASCSMMHPDLFRKYAVPYEKKLIGHIQNKVPAILHVCQNSQPVIGDMLDTGALVLEIDFPVDIRTARDIVKNGAVIKGNINSTLLESESSEEIKKVIRDTVDVMKDNLFILSTGDSVAPNTPDDSIRCLFDAV